MYRVPTIRMKTTYRASFYGLSNEFLRAIERVFIRCMTCSKSHDSKETDVEAVYKNDEQPGILITPTIRLDYSISICSTSMPAF